MKQLQYFVTTFSLIVAQLELVKKLTTRKADMQGRAGRNDRVTYS